MMVITVFIKKFNIMKNLESVSRAEFLKTLGLSGKALLAVYCLGAVTACSEEESPEPMDTNNKPGETKGIEGVTGTTSGSVDFKVDLTNSKWATLKTQGNFEYVEEIMIANASGTFIALAKACPHAGTTVQFRKDKNDVWCSNHGSEFATDGKLNKGPATTGLKMYTTTLSMDGNTLTVKG